MTWALLTFRADTEAELQALAGQMPPSTRWLDGSLKLKWRGLFVTHRVPLAEVTTTDDETGETTVVHAADPRWHVCAAADLDWQHPDGAGGTVTMRDLLTALADTLAPYLVPWPERVAKVGGGEVPEWEGNA